MGRFSWSVLMFVISAVRLRYPNIGRQDSLRLVLMASTLAPQWSPGVAEESSVPRALSRDEQAILALVRRSGVSLPIPELAAQLGLDPAVAQAACEYLVGRGLLQATVYAVGVPAGTKPATATAAATVR